MSDCLKGQQLLAGLHGSPAYVLLILLVPLGATALGMLLVFQATVQARLALLPPPATRTALIAARQGLMAWALARPLLQTAGDAQPGLVPYPDRHTDGNYDGTSDCLSGTGIARPQWRVGKLPFGGEQQPCEGRSPGEAETSPGSTTVVGRALAALQVREPGSELLWYAAAVPLLDDDLMHHYPDVTVTGLLQQEEGWLVVCDTRGRVLRRDAALVVMAPGPPLPAQSRRGRAPDRRQFLEGMSLADNRVCGPAPGNQQSVDVFVKPADVLPRPDFNDRLVLVSRLRWASALAVAQGTQLGRMVQQSKPFPFAALPGAADGRCRPSVLRGNLPLESGPGCEGVVSAPAWLRRLPGTVLVGEGSEIEYTRNPAGDRATLQFKGCAIRFQISPTRVSHGPSLC